MRKRLLVVGAAVFAAAAIVLTIYTIHQTTPTPETVTRAPRAAPASPTAPAASITPLPLPAPNLVVKPTATMAWSKTLEPADFVNVFQLVDPTHGYLASGGTIYLITHSYAAGGGAPGNTWETLVVGDIVQEGSSLYRIDYVATPPQGAISSEPIWYNDPNLLVMITCKSRGAGYPATNNYVIRAERIGSL